MKVTVFGNPDSIFNIELNKKISEKGINVEIFSLYAELDKLVKYKIKFVSKFIAMIKFFNRFKILSRKENILHIQSLTYFVPSSFFFIRVFFAKKILTFWGSDLLTKSKKELQKYKYLFNTLDTITFATEDMRMYFLSLFPKYKHKTEIVRFGLSELDIIDLITEDEISNFRKKYFQNTKKEIVTIGYNRVVGQQHIDVVKNINQELKNNCYFVFPWSYGTIKNGYKEELLQVLNEKEFEYVFLENFLSDKEVACLRKVTKIFVQVQTKDALSGSMQEALYSGSYVITGDWLNYSILDESGIDYFKVSTPQDVGNTISNITNSKTELDYEKNKIIINNLSKWDKCIINWCKLYENNTKFGGIIKK